MTLGFDPAREEEELRAYLGAAFDRSRLVDWHDQLEHEALAMGDEDRLYRTSEGYLYNLTAFAMTGTKLPYLEELVAEVPAGASVLDMGCGIGSDGLLLAERGLRVTFADFDNPSTRYLRWRLERRGIDARIVDLDRERPPTGFDLAYAFDVLEHVEDPWQLLGELERCADRVLVNVLETDEADTVLHRELPVASLVRHAAGRDLRRYRLLHGCSHLLLYRPRPVGPVRRARNRLRVLAGRPRARRG